MKKFNKVLVTGGAGYVGARLIPELLAQGYEVNVLDLFLYGDDVLTANPKLSNFKGDLRDRELVIEALKGCDAVIHLACISNDPSFELNRELGKSINFDAFEPLVKLSIDAGVKRFIYASSSSVYGIKEEERVTEELPLEPLTDYSKFKAMCEEVLLKYTSDTFTTLIVRPSTVCGYSPRLRLDLVVNILTNHAYTNRKIKVFGGDQYRPNIHIEDMVDFYIQSLLWDAMVINGEIFNVGHKNHTVNELATLVKQAIGDDVTSEVVESDDNRSYRVCNDKAKRILNFECKRTIYEAASDLRAAFESGKIKNSMDSKVYYNIKKMQQVELV